MTIDFDPLATLHPDSRLAQVWADLLGLEDTEGEEE